MASWIRTIKEGVILEVESRRTRLGMAVIHGIVLDKTSVRRERALAYVAEACHGRLVADERREG